MKRCTAWIYPMCCTERHYCVLVKGHRGFHTFEIEATTPDESRIMTAVLWKDPKRTPPSKKSQEALVDRWKDVAPGTEVIVTKDSGEEVRTRTDSPPKLLGGHTAVIWLVGMSSCYSLERVRLAPRARKKAP